MRVYPADPWGCGHYRLIWPAEALQAQGHDVEIVYPKNPSGMIGHFDKQSNVYRVEVKPEAEADVFVFQRPTNKLMAGMVERLVEQGRRVVIDMDDDLSTIHPGNLAFKRLHPKYSPRNNWQWAAHACKIATRVTVSTDGLVPRYGAHGRVKVLRNHIPRSFLEVPRPQKEEPVWGWSGTLTSHPNDVPMLRGVVDQLRPYPFHVVGDPTGIAKAVGTRGEISATGVLPLEEWPKRLVHLDVGVAPLADTRFNRCKSWLKPLEYAAAGVPWVASDRFEYRRFWNETQGGTIVAGDRSREWVKRVRDLLRNHTYRQEQSEKARSAAAQFTIEDNAWLWWEAWTDW